MWINLGRLLMLGVWGFMLANLLHAFPRPLNIFVNVAMVFTVLMHGLQVTLLKSTLPADNRKLGFWQELRIFLFGVFELLAWQKRQPRNKPNHGRRSGGVGGKADKRLPCTRRIPCMPGTNSAHACSGRVKRSALPSTALNCTR